MSVTPEERPPRVAWGLYKRFALGGLAIVFLTAAAVSTAALLEVKGVSDVLKRYQHKVHFRAGTITKAQAGKPQTLLLVGSDRRYGAAKGDARSDTMMLLRLDPDQQATAVMSVPRDLKVEIPGRGTAKMNEAYSLGGLDLVTRTIKQLLGIDINHAIGVNFKDFRRVVDFIHCVYVDVDRRYYHSNAGLPPSQQYAEINIEPGYQKLCGSKALDYVRFRHLDNDLVRAARQQDFLRSAKEQVGTSTLLSNLTPLTTIFAKSTEADGDLQSNSGILRLLKLAAFSAGHPIREVHFPGHFVQAPTGPDGQVDPRGLGDYVEAAPDELAKATDEFLHAKASSGPRPTARPATSTTAKRRKKGAGKKADRTYADFGLVDARRRGEDLVASTVASGRPGFPLYFPSALTPLGRYTTVKPMPRVYSIRDRAGKLHRAYRLVVIENELEGQYYGVQGTTWRNAPFLARAHDTKRMVGRTYELIRDGSRLRAVAWRTPRAVYWISNTLSLELTNKEMLGLARSLTRFGAR